MELKEGIKKEITVIQEGIDACKEDCEDAKASELQYIFGKSQALKIMKMRFDNLLISFTEYRDYLKNL